MRQFSGLLYNHVALVDTWHAPREHPRPKEHYDKRFMQPRTGETPKSAGIGLISFSSSPNLWRDTLPGYNT
jgi:hypothetical protein